LFDVWHFEIAKTHKHLKRWHFEILILFTEH